MSGYRKHRKASTDKGQMGKGGAARATSPLLVAYAALVRSNERLYQLDRQRAAQRTALDMAECGTAQTEAMRRRLAQLARLRAETPLPDVLLRVATIAERNLPCEAAETRAAS